MIELNKPGKQAKLIYNKGFALVATISIVALVLMIALTMLSLATVSSKTRSYSYHVEQARANARLALAEAISKLQSIAGADTRITASSGILGDGALKRPHLTGVWRSLGDVEGGIVTAANAESELPASYTDKARGGRFIEWLVSGGNTDVSYPISAVASSSGVPEEGYQTIVGRGTLGDDEKLTSQYVHAKKKSVGDQGSYAWWVGDEGLKARVNLNSEALKDSLGASLIAAQAAPSLNPSKLTRDPFDYSSDAELQDELRGDEGSKVVSFETIGLVGSGVNKGTLGNYFFDVSSRSLGLHTSVYGGLKRDLSVVTEVPRLSPSYKIDPTDPVSKPSNVFDRSQTWKEVRNFTRSYKSKDKGGKIDWSSGKPVLKPLDIFNDRIKVPQWWEYFPKISKWYTVISVMTEPNSEDLTKYDVRLVYDLLFELWNPYNLPFEPGSDIDYVWEAEGLPFSMTYGYTEMQDTDNDGVGDSAVQRIFNDTKDFPYPVIYTFGHMGGGSSGSSAHDIGFLRMPFKSPASRSGLDETSFRAGSSYVYSVGDNMNAPVSAGDTEATNFYRGWNIKGGWYSDQLTGSEQTDKLTVDADSKLTFDVVADPSKKISAKREFLYKLHGKMGEIGQPVPSERNIIGGGIHASSDGQDGRFDWKKLRYIIGDEEAQRNADGSFKALASTAVLAKSASGKKIPLFASIAHLRTEHEGPFNNSVSAKIKTKYYLYSNPLGRREQFHTAGREDSVPSDLMTTANTPIVYSWKEVSNFANTPLLIEMNDSYQTGAGYHGTSIQATNGQNVVVAREIPIVGLTSLAQLQHSTLGYPKSVSKYYQGYNWSYLDVGHPHVHNATGNSYAHPVISQTKIVEGPLKKPNYKGALEETYLDKSWHANQVLWDDYYFSSVSDLNHHVYTQLSESVDAEQVLSNALAGEGTLPNARYRVHQKMRESDAVELAKEILDKGIEGGEYKISQYLVSLGDFNVNSTSVNAWKAFLGSLDQQELAYLDSETSVLKTETPSTRFSRFTVPGQLAADSLTAHDDLKFLQKRWGGARQVTDEELNDLAIKMVEQVKMRGPFLSLAEFVNRRLESGENGLKGALQAAIDNTRINDSFKTSGNKITEDDIAERLSQSDTDIGIRNQEAALGYTGEGAPGYITQADVLMALGPFIKVRSDTFRVRGYGESRNTQGEIVATAYCESMVQRTYDYVDGKDKCDIELRAVDGSEAATLSDTNRKYGRRFKVVSFKWLTEYEI